MATTGNQMDLRLAWGVANNVPKDAPVQVVRRTESEAHALKIMIEAGNHKLEPIAKSVKKSVPYISRMQNGKRPIPHKLIGPLCAATGSNLLRQYHEFQRALSGGCEVSRLAAMVREAA